MDSLDAQCLIVHLTRSDPVGCPDEWSHDADGGLSAAFAGSPRSFTWTVTDVESLARRWRSLGASPPPPLEQLIKGHLAFVRMTERGGLPRPDRILHDVARHELTAFFDDSGVAVVVGDDEAAPAPRA